MLDSVWSPIMLLALVGYGVLAGTSGASRAKLVAGFVLSGLGAGIAAAPWFSPFGAFSALIVGVVCSGQSAASLANPPKFMLPALGFAVGITAT